MDEEEAGFEPEQQQEIAADESGQGEAAAEEEKEDQDAAVEAQVEPLESNVEASRHEQEEKVEADEQVVDKEIKELIAEIEQTLNASDAQDLFVEEAITTSEDRTHGSDGSADQSSPATADLADQAEGKHKRLSKQKPAEIGSDDDSAHSLTAEEAALPDTEPKTPPPTSPKETQTDWHASKVEIINLPVLKEMRNVRPEEENHHAKFQEHILGTGITARFKGPMPLVVMPLDKFDPVESGGRISTCGRITPRGSTLEVVSTYCARTAGNVVDAQVTHCDDGKKRGIRLDIDGGGLQVVLDVAQKKKKRKPQRKVKRTPFSIRPPKKKNVLCPSALRKLAWLEDCSEDNHVRRMQCGRDRRSWTPVLAQVSPPDFGPRWKDWSVSPYSKESPISKVGRSLQSTTQHHQQMELARALEKAKNEPRKLASPPRFVPPATELPPSAGEPNIYETDVTRRLREAREYYGRLSTQAQDAEPPVVSEPLPLFEEADISLLEEEVSAEEGGEVKEDADDKGEAMESAEEGGEKVIEEEGESVQEEQEMVLEEVDNGGESQRDAEEEGEVQGEILEGDSQEEEEKQDESAVQQLEELEGEKEEGGGNEEKVVEPEG